MKTPPVHRSGASRLPEVPGPLLQAPLQAPKAELPPSPEPSADALRADAPRLASDPARQRAVRSVLELRAAPVSGEAAAAELHRVLDGPASVEEKLAWVGSAEGQRILAAVLRAVKPAELATEVQAFARHEGAVLAFETAATETKGKVAALFGRVGRAGREAIDGLRDRLRAAKEALAALVALPLKEQLGRLTRFIADNVVLLTPVVAPIVAAAAGMPVVPALIAGLGFAGSIKAIEIILQDERIGLMSSLEKLLPPDLLPIARATSTNAPELGSVVGTSLQAGMPLAAGAAGALASTPWNTFFLLAAYVAALPKRVAALRAKETDPETGARPSFVSALAEVWKRSDWKAAGAQLGIAALFAVDALLFFAAAKSGTVPVLAWLGANVPILALFLHRTAFSKEARTRAAAGQLVDAEVEALREDWKQRFGQRGELIELLEAIAGARRSRPAEGEGGPKALIELVERLKPQLETDPELKRLLATLEASAPKSALDEKMVGVLKALGIDAFEEQPLDRVALAKTIAGIGAFGVAAAGLGVSAGALGASVGLSVFVINAVVVAMASSLPEFSIAKKLFEEGKDFDAGYIESASNATNIGFGMLAVMLYSGRKLACGA